MNMHRAYTHIQWYFKTWWDPVECVIPSFLPCFISCLNWSPCSPVCFPSCCVSRRLHGGQTSWWSMQKTSWPSMPSTWMPLWKSSHLRAGTASPSSSCSTTSSGWTVSSWPTFNLSPLHIYLCLSKGANIFLFLPLFGTDHLCNGKFHKHLQDLYAPLVVRYVDLMESSIAQSIHKGFDRESWEPVK